MTAAENGTLGLCWMLAMTVCAVLGYYIGHRGGSRDERVFRIESERRIIAVAADEILKAREQNKPCKCYRCWKRRRARRGGRP